MFRRYYFSSNSFGSPFFLAKAPLCRDRKPLHSIRALRRIVLAKGDASGGIWCDRRLAVADSGQEHYSSNNPPVTVVGCHRDQRLLQYLFCRPFYRPFRHLLGRGRHRAPILVVLFTFFAGRLVSHGSGLSLTLRLPRVPYAPTHRRILLLPQLKRWSRFVASVIYP